MKVIKIGGGSLRRKKDIGDILDLVAARGRGHIIVVSALNGITDMLIAGMTSALQDEASIRKTMDDLKNRHLLLIIDNCEHLIDAVAERTGAGMVYSDYHDIQGGQRVSHPVIECQLGAIRDDFNFGSLLFFDTRTLKAAAAARRRGLFGKSAWERLQAAYEVNRVDGRLPATFEVIYGHAWAGDKTRLADGRQVIQMKIANKRAGR